MAKRKVKLGKAIKWTDDDLDRLAEITPADIEAAKAWWAAYAPRRFKKLLEAKPEETDATANP